MFTMNIGVADVTLNEWIVPVLNSFAVTVTSFASSNNSVNAKPLLCFPDPSAPLPKSMCALTRDDVRVVFNSVKSGQVLNVASSVRRSCPSLKEPAGGAGENDTLTPCSGNSQKLILGSIAGI